MPHSLVLGLFGSVTSAARATKVLHGDGFKPESLSIVARSHAEETSIAKDLGATPGVEIEDSRPASRLGELGAAVIAAVSIVMPGVAPLIAAGPLAAELGEAAGHMSHVAGGLAGVLARSGLDDSRAQSWQRAVEEGRVLLGVHVADAGAAGVRQILLDQGAESVELAHWEGALP